MKRILGILLVGLMALPAFAEKKGGTQVTTGGRTYNIGSVTGPNYQHEVLLNGVGFGAPIAGGAAGSIAVGSGTTIAFGGGYNYAIIPDLMIGGGFTVADQSGTTSWSILAGPTYNLIYNGNVQDSFFLQGMLGVAGSAGLTGFSFRFDAGKRFEIFPHFTWKPSLGVLFIGNGLGTRFVINLLSASLQF